MRLRDVHSDHHRQPSATVEQPPSIDGWLDLFERLLHLPGGQREAIREELRGHLDERTRDLMLRGADGGEALRQAIEELGEAAELAERFRHANRDPRRRLIMNTLLVGAGTLVVVASVAVMTNGGQPAGEVGSNPAMYAAAEQEQRQANASTLDGIDITLELEMTPRDVVDAIVATKQIGVSVDWGSLGEAGIDPDEPLGMEAEAISVLAALNEINRRFDEAWDTIDWRVQGRMLIIDRREVFDRQECVLMAYDVSGPLHGMIEQHHLEYDEATEQMCSLIYEMVEPQQWDVNGGALAHLRIVGGKMFVHAPLRIHEKTNWILGELSRPGDAHAGAGMPEPNAMPNPTAAQRQLQALNNHAMARLRNIHMGLLIHGQEFEDKPLQNVQQLVEHGYLPVGETRSPFGPAADGQDYWIDFANLQPEDVDWSRRIVGIDRAMYEQGGAVAALFADGHVELLPIARLHAVLEDDANEGVKPNLPRRRADVQQLETDVQLMSLESRLVQMQDVLARLTDERNRMHDMVESMKHELEVAVRTRELALEDNAALKQELARLREQLSEDTREADLPGRQLREAAGSAG